MQGNINTKPSSEENVISNLNIFLSKLILLNINVIFVHFSSPVGPENCHVFLLFDWFYLSRSCQLPISEIDLQGVLREVLQKNQN